MFHKILILSILLLGFWGESLAQTSFQLSFTQQKSFSLLWNDQEYILQPNSKGWLDTEDQNFKTFPLEIVIPVQLIYKLHSTPSSPADEILNNLSQEFLVSKDTLIQLAADAAYAMKNKSLLKELIPLSNFSKQAGLVYFYGSQLEEDFVTKKDLLKRALALSPKDPGIQKAAQYFSLAVAEGVLLDYEERLLEAQIFRVLDMEGVQATTWGAFKEVVFNTANSLSIIFTEREEGLYTQWEAQLEYIQNLRLEIARLKHSIEEGEELGPLPQTPFFKEMSTTGFYLDETIPETPSPFPSLEKLGFIPETDFVSYSWKSIGIGQVNLFNIWMFTLLPKHLRDFGATQAGQWTIKTLRLRSFLNFLSRIPRPLDSVAVFLAIETADGCTIRWTYTALVAHDKLTRDTQSNTIKTIEENLKK